MKLVLFSALALFVATVASNDEPSQKIQILHNLLNSKCPGLVSYDLNSVTYGELFSGLLKCNRMHLERKLLPVECLSAANFTQAWRVDHDGSGHRPAGQYSHNGFACDFNKDIEWFRFSGAGGNRMLNTCPKKYSCGTSLPYWSDAEAPKIVGVVKTVDAYQSDHGNCMAFSVKVDVMRCSANDVIYKVVRPIKRSRLDFKCYEAFCGMM